MIKINLPQNSGEAVTVKFGDCFAPYSTVKVGDYLIYNPNLNRLVVVTSEDRPEYVIKNISKHILKKNIQIKIERI